VELPGNRVAAPPPPMSARSPEPPRARGVLRDTPMPSPRRASLVAAAALALSAGRAAAAPDRCASVDADLSTGGTDLIELAGDTGWFPSGYAAQLRLTGQIAAHTWVDLGLSPTACWDAGMVAHLPARPATGVLDVAYGAQLQLFGHVDTTVLGYHVFWEGQIPIPYIPEDLLIGGSTTFDPSLGAPPATVYDTTDPVPLIRTDVLGSIIAITGISGNLHVDVTGAMETSYRTTALVTPDGEITTPNGSIGLDRPAAGWGATADLAVSARGQVHYDPSLIFSVGVDLRIFGIRVVDYTLLSVPMGLPAFDRELTLTGDPTRIPLPELAALGDGARVDFADAEVQELEVANRGAGPLAIEVASAPPGISAAAVTIAPGATTVLRITASPGALAAGVTAPLVLATNDPDHPTLSIDVGIDVGGNDPGEDDHGGQVSAGCSAGGGGGGALALVVVGLALATRRRSRRSPR